jgi:hypothetical protein
MGEKPSYDLHRHHWAVLRALELGDFPVDKLGQHLDFCKPRG